MERYKSKIRLKENRALLSFDYSGESPLFTVGDDSIFF